jgi:hypothetical protein
VDARCSTRPSVSGGAWLFATHSVVSELLPSVIAATSAFIPARVRPPVKRRGYKSHA